MGEPEDKKEDLDITGKISPVFSCPCCDHYQKIGNGRNTLEYGFSDLKRSSTPPRK